MKKIKFNEEETQLLSWTSAMSCWSFSLPAKYSCPGMLAENRDHVCHSCYAMINRYNMPNVIKSQWIRFNWLRYNLRSDHGKKEIIDTLTSTIQQSAKNGFFRISDSGDFFSPDYVRCWYEVCYNLPDIRFWAPTRSHRIPKILTELQKLNSLSNVAIRPSALTFNEPAPNVLGLAAGSTVVLDQGDLISGSLCPKTINGGSCEDNNCRSCWDSPNIDINYLVHGTNGQSKRANALSEKIVETRRKYSAKYIKLTIGGSP